MNHIRHGRKNVVGKQTLYKKYSANIILVEKCNRLHVSISCVIQLIDLN